MPRRILALSFVVVAVGSVSLQAQESAKRPANRLTRETSPYLLLHAHNPVDWYPWGPEAFAKAKAENKPVFLSVGYSSCNWCHVMERESFENAAIAKILNDRFVCIKVDREERPDVDQVYMAALQEFGRGGWPMSMFLSPEGKPFFGGTYFPPADRDGMDGFGSILGRVADAWRDHRAELLADADRLSEHVRKALDAQAGRGRRPLSRAMADAGAEALAGQFDPEFGGFGFDPEVPRRPKFPEPVNLLFLLDRHSRRGAGEKTSGATGPLAMVVTTLDRMARGGIRDQLAGGYHRYSTTRFWDVPHFEKMLYDNAQLAETHLRAFEATGDPRWRSESEATFAFVARTMTDPAGGFYSALDAETGGEEGAYYVWTRDEVKAAVGDGPAYEAFAKVYGTAGEPNFEKGRYVLREPLPRSEQAVTLGKTPEALEALLDPARTSLLAAREKRPAPLLDDKVLTSWNGLMIAAYAEGFRVLKDPRYRTAAEKAADFLWATLRDPDGRLLRTYRAGKAKLPAYLEDYAFFANGLLRLHAATGEPKRLEQARALTDRMLADFGDPAAGGFFATANDHESLIARPKDAVDGVLPSPNSVAVRNLIALAKRTGEDKYLDAAGKTLDAFSERLTRIPGNSPLLLVALEEYLDARPELKTAAVPPPSDADPIGLGAADVVTAVGELATGAGAVKLVLKVKPGWHVYANPSGADGIPPTRVTVDPGQSYALDRVEFPPGEAKVLAASGKEKVNLYEGTVSLVVHIKPDSAYDGKPDPATGVRLTLHYQACNDRACLAPAKLSVYARAED